jgi:hypothetical protein
MGERGRGSEGWGWLFYGSADDVRFFTRFGCLSGVIQQEF